MIDPSDVSQAIRLAAGKPDLVIVDRRVLQLLMGDLAALIVLGDVADEIPGATLRSLEDFDEKYIWDSVDPFPCGSD